MRLTAALFGDDDAIAPLLDDLVARLPIYRAAAASGRALHPATAMLRVLGERCPDRFGLAAIADSFLWPTFGGAVRLSYALMARVLARPELRARFGDGEDWDGCLSWLVLEGVRALHLWPYLSAGFVAEMRAPSLRVAGRRLSPLQAILIGREPHLQTALRRDPGEFARSFHDWFPRDGVRIYDLAWLLTEAELAQAVRADPSGHGPAPPPGLAGASADAAYIRGGGSFPCVTLDMAAAARAVASGESRPALRGGLELLSPFIEIRLPRLYQPAALVRLDIAIPAPVDVRVEVCDSLGAVHVGRDLGASPIVIPVVLRDPSPRLRLWFRRGGAPATGASEVAICLAVLRSLDVWLRFADPPDVAALLELAAAWRDVGEIAAARPLLAAARRQDPGNLAVLLHQGDLERAAGDDAAALATYVAAASDHPHAARPLVEAAIQCRTLGRPAEAASWLERALATSPGDAAALQQQADLAWLADDYDDCLAICRRAGALHPDLAWPDVMAARAHGARGDWREGLRLLDTAACGPTPEIAVGRIALLKAHGGGPHIRDALASAPDDSFPLWIERVQYDIAHGAFAAAEATLAAPPARSARERARVATLRGALAEARWRIDDAVAHYRQALRLAPGDAGTHDELARASLLRLDLVAAEAHNAAAVRLNETALRLRGEPLDPLLGHFGQILDEYRMDPETVAALAALSPLPAGERIAPLRAMVLDNPDSTPAAICLLLALRQAGLLAGEAAAPGAAIPRRIAQFWHAPAPPADVAELMATWPAYNPDWHYQRFDARAARRFLADHFGPDICTAFRQAAHPAQQADLFRLAWLHESGGVYADADDRCLGPLDALAPPGRSLLGYQEGFGSIGNNMLGAAPGQPVIARALRDAAMALNRGDGDSLWLCTGPGLITRAFAAELAASPLGAGQWLAGIGILDRHQIAPAVAVHRFARYKTTGNNWKRAGRLS